MNPQSAVKSKITHAEWPAIRRPVPEPIIQRKAALWPIHAQRPHHHLARAVFPATPPPKRPVFRRYLGSFTTATVNMGEMGGMHRFCGYHRPTSRRKGPRPPPAIPLLASNPAIPALRPVLAIDTGQSGVHNAMHDNSARRRKVCRDLHTRVRCLEATQPASGTDPPHAAGSL